MAKKRLRVEAKLRVARRSRRRQDNRGDATTSGQKDANGRGVIQVAKGRGGVSGQEAAERREDERRRRHDMRRCDNQPETEAKPPPPPPPSRLRVSKKKRSDIELQRAVLWCTVS